MSESRKIRVLVAWHAMGPYHVARMRALAEHPRLDLTVTRLCAQSPERQWTFDPGAIGAPFYEADRLPEALLGRLEVLVVAGWYEKGFRRLFGRVGAGCRRMVFSESCAHDRLRIGLKEALKRRRLGAVDGALAAGRLARRYLEELGLPPERIWEVGNIADARPFRRAAELAAASERDAATAGCILYAGRLAPEKNLEALLRGYAKAARSGIASPPPLVFAGSGPETARLEGIASELALADRVRFLGETAPEPLARLMAACGFLVLASLREPWGLVVNEAMSAGRPVLASPACGCQPELLRPGASWLLRGFTSDDVAEGLARALNMRREWDAMGRHAAELAALLTPESYARRAADAIDSVLRMPRRGPAVGHARAEPPTTVVAEYCA